MTDKKQPWEDTVKKFKEADRKELIRYIQQLEDRLKEKNGHKNPVWYKYTFNKTKELL